MASLQTRSTRFLAHIQAAGLLFIFLALPSAAFGQAAVEGGIKAGINLATLSVPSSELSPGQEVKSLRGMAAGLWLGRDFGSNFGVSVEALFSQRGMKSVVRDQVFGESFTAESRARITYLDLPLLLKWRSAAGSGARFSVGGGPLVGLKLSSKVSVESVIINGVDVTREFMQEIEDELRDFDLDKTTRTVDVGLTFGAGVEWRRFTVDARYLLGVADVSTEDGSPVTKSRTLSLLIGYRLK